MTTPEQDEHQRLNEPRLLETEGYLNRALRRLGEGLGPFVYEKLRGKELLVNPDGEVLTRDLSIIFAKMERLQNWNRLGLGSDEWNHFGLLIGFRNGPWAHLKGYSDEKVIHFLSVIRQLLTAIGATQQAEQVDSYFWGLVALLSPNDSISDATEEQPLDDPQQPGSRTKGGRAGRAGLELASDDQTLTEAVPEEETTEDASETLPLNVSSDRLGEFLVLGRSAHEEGKIEEAGIYFNIVRQLDPEFQFEPADAGIFQAQGEAFAQKGDYRSAITNYDIALAIDPSLPLAPRYGASLSGRAQLLSPLSELGYCGEQYSGRFLLPEVSADNHRQALSDYTEALKIDPENARVYHHNRGQVYFALEEFDQAIADFTTALEKDHGEGDAYFNRGDVYYNRGQAHLAREAYQLAIADFELVDSIKEADRYRNRRGAIIGYGRKRQLRTIARCSAVIKARPRNAEAYLERGQAYVWIARSDLGTADYDEARRLDSSRGAEALVLRGIAFSLTEQYDLAILDFDAARLLQSDLEIDSIYAEAHGKRGAMHFESGHYDFAIADYSAVLEYISDHPRAYYDRGRAYAAKEDYTQAVAEFRSALQVLERADSNVDDDYVEETFGFDDIYLQEESYVHDIPLTFLMYFEMAKAYSRMGDYESSIDNFDKVFDEITSSIHKGDYEQDFKHDYDLTIYNRRGNAYFALKNYQQAIEDYSWAMEVGQLSRNPVLWRNRGMAYYNNKQFDLAVKDFDAFLKIRPGDELVQDRREKAISHVDVEAEFAERNAKDYETWYFRGAHYADAGDSELGLSDLSRALEVQQEVLGLPVGRMADLQLLGRLEEASTNEEQESAMYGQLKRQIVDRVDILLARAQAYYSLGQENRAWDDLDRATGLDPDNPVAWYRRGRAQQRQERFSEAVTEFDRAIALQETFLEAYRFRGMCHYRLGNYGQAREDANKALEDGIEP